MARKKSKPKPMRSRRSGIKSLALVKANHEILKKYM